LGEEDFRERFRRIPPAFREQYISVLGEAEEETLHPDLYSRLVDDGTDMIVRKLREYNEGRRSLLKSLRGRIEVRRLVQDEDIASLRVVASDAGNNGADFRSAFIPLYASAAISAEGWKIIDDPIFRVGDPEIWPLLKSLRGRIEVRRLVQDEDIASLRVVASDAGNNGADFRSAFIPLYASAAISAEGWKIIDDPIFRVGDPEIWPDEFRSHDRESLLASKIQFEVTAEAIEIWKPKYVLLDGSLLVNFWLLPSLFGSTREYEEDFNSTVTRSVELLLKCYEEDIPIAGFVKRTRMNDICAEVGVPKMRDTALLDLLLNLGEYTAPRPISARNPVIDRYRRVCQNMGVPEGQIDDILGIHFSYIKTGLTTPFRLEIPRYCLNSLDEVGTLIFTTSEEESGIPFVINEVDNITRITATTSNIRTLMIYSKMLDLVKRGEMAPEDMNLLALQYGESWVLRDGERLKA